MSQPPLDLDAAPMPMLAEIASWLGIELEPEWPDERREIANREIAKTIAGVVGRRGVRRRPRCACGLPSRGRFRAAEWSPSTCLWSSSTTDTGLPPSSEAPAPEVLPPASALQPTHPQAGPAQLSSGAWAFEADAHRFSVYVPASLLPDDGARASSATPSTTSGRARRTTSS